VATAFQILAGIIQKTPVDTGRARANWFLSEGAPVIASTLPTGKDKDGRPTFAVNATPQASITGRARIFITNSLPYIVPLEYGHSQQAPAGMVRVTLAEVSALATVATR
jgi:hypothetical protein